MIVKDDWKAITRRDMLKFIGGAAMGTALSPLPWKLMDDSSIWTQNWSWVPVPLEGEIGARFTTCTACAAGCGLRVRTVDGRPVFLGGVPGHPVSKGATCPIGLGGLQLAFHPARVLWPRRRDPFGGGAQWSPVGREKALVKIAGRLAGLISESRGDRVAVLDPRPGRTLSLLYREFLGRLGSSNYLVPPDGAGESLVALRDMLEEDPGEIGLNLEGANLILSFGTPLLDGWGPTGRRLHWLRGGSRRPRIIQAENRCSPTAAAADRWLPLKPGSEAALALGIAHVLIREGFFDQGRVESRALDFSDGGMPGYRTLVAGFPPVKAAAITGLKPEVIVETARVLSGRGPSLVIGWGDPGGGPLGREEEIAIWGLNFLLGNMDRNKLVAARTPEARPDRFAGLDSGPEFKVAPRAISDVPDGSLQFLIIDGATPVAPIPAELIIRKLCRERSLVVSLSPYSTGPASLAEYILPTPSPAEALDEAPTPFGAVQASLGISEPLIEPPEEAMHAGDWVSLITARAGMPPGGEGSFEDLLRKRVEAIYAAGRGTVFMPAGDGDQGKTTDLTAVGSADELWKTLKRGGCWSDSSEPAPITSPVRLLGAGRDGFERIRDAGQGRLVGMHGHEVEYPLILTLYGEAGTGCGSIPLPMALSKLFRESDLRDMADQARVNPETGHAHGFLDEQRAVIESSRGQSVVTLLFDRTVMPGVVQVPAGPDVHSFGPLSGRSADGIISLCDLHPGSGNATPTWRLTRVRLKEV